MPTHCDTCGVDIKRSDTIKGFEIEKGVWAIVTEQEMDALDPESSDTMEITSTVSLAEIDPLLYESSFYLEPEPAGRRGFKLLMAALEAEHGAAIAKVTLFGREQVVIIRPFDGLLVMHTLFYQDEVREAPDCGLKDIDVKPAELKLARQLLAANAEKFDHAAYKDGYRASVEALLEAKRNKKPVSISKRAATKKADPVPDLLAVMAASVKASKERKRA
jgi:DNA end-binding protein Ku